MCEAPMKEVLAGGVCLPYGNHWVSVDSDVLYAGRHLPTIAVVYDGFLKHPYHSYKYVKIGLEMHLRQRDERYALGRLLSRELREKLEAALCGCL